ncbi:MAG: hypothetical protein IJ512_06200 [Ruminococcus sp.]|nr:hypothetical protein [Ruminococcus sp.]
MKTWKKFCAAAISAALLSGIASSLSASADYSLAFFTRCINDTSYRYEFVDTYGAFSAPILRDDCKVYNAYRRVYSSGSEEFIVCFDPTYNVTTFEISDTEQFSQIYAKYESTLNFDSYTLTEMDGFYTAVMYHKQKVCSDFSFPMQLDTIQAMCDEMKAAGIVNSAVYNYCSYPTAALAYADFSSILLEESLTTETEGMAEILEKHSAYIESVSENKIKLFRASSDQMVAVVEDIMAAFPGYSVHPDAAFYLDTYSGSHSPRLDLLTNSILDFPKEDVNQSGSTDIEDAIIVLQLYAENAVSGTSEFPEAYDVDGNGTLDIKDASNVLSCYANAAAGV